MSAGRFKAKNDAQCVWGGNGRVFRFFVCFRPHHHHIFFLGPRHHSVRRAKVSGPGFPQLIVRVSQAQGDQVFCAVNTGPLANRTLQTGCFAWPPRPPGGTHRVCAAPPHAHHTAPAVHCSACQGSTRVGHCHTCMGARDGWPLR